METIISEIRKKGFDKLQKEFEDKLNLKRKLEQSITTLKQNIATYNNKKKLDQIMILVLLMLN